MAATSTARGTGRHRKPRTDSGDLRASDRDTRRYYREVSQRPDPHREAYEAGLANGDRPGPEAPDSVHEAYNAGQADAQAKKAAPKPAAQPKAAAGGGGGTSVSTSWSHEGAGFLLGLVGYALVASYLEYGWPGVTGWLSAKFLNTVTIGTKPGSGAFNLSSAAAPSHVVAT